MTHKRCSTNSGIAFARKQPWTFSSFRIGISPSVVPEGQKNSIGRQVKDNSSIYPHGQHTFFPFIKAIGPWWITNCLLLLLHGANTILYQPPWYSWKYVVKQITITFLPATTASLLYSKALEGCWNQGIQTEYRKQYDIKKWLSAPNSTSAKMD